MEGIPSKGVMCNAYIILKGLVLTKTNLLITTWTISVWTAATLLDQVSPALTSHVASTFAWQPHRTTAQALKLFRFCRRFATGKMVKRCVVYGCGNSCKTEHRYCPRISEESDNRSRESSPTTNSQAVICEAHFDGNCYSTEVLRMAELSGFGVKKIKIVVPGTVPTITPIL